MQAQVGDFSQGTSVHILDARRDDLVQLVMPKPQLVAIGRVLHQPKIQKYLHWDDVTISRFIHELRTFAEVVSGTTPLEISDDPTDNMLFAVAMEAGAHYLIGGDGSHILSIGFIKALRPSARDNL